MTRLNVTAAQRDELGFVVETYSTDDQPLDVDFTHRTFVTVPDAQLDDLAWACGTQREIHEDNDNHQMARSMLRLCEQIRDAGGHDFQADQPNLR